MKKLLLGTVLGAMTAGVAMAGDLAVSAYWQDHMVLQRGKPITVWGKDAAGRSVTVSFAGETAHAVTDSGGFWETTFAQPFALSSTPQTLVISDNASESISLTDILVGDVFLAAGQSNMDRRLDDPPKQFQEPQAVKDFCRDDDGIRFIRIARSAENTSAGEELFDLPPHKAVNDAIKYFGEGYDWSPAVGTNRNYVSSVALNFARYIRDTNTEKGQNIPIGIIHASSGGTAIRSWISQDTLRDNNLNPVSTDSWYWNRMMAPILRAKFRAVLWYQGCSDAGKTVAEYKNLMDVLVKDRRDRWGDNGDLPFYAVQIGTPGYANGEIQTMNLDHYPTPTEINNGQNYALVREAQRQWDLSDTGTHGLAVILDHVRCKDASDLHPVDKNFVGRRLSLFARRDLYGEPDLVTDGPVFSRAVREADGAVRISFKPGTAKGLTSGRYKMAGELTLSRFVKMDEPVRGFAVCGSDNVWHEAVATVEGETVVLRADGVDNPTRFHYGFWCITRTDNMEFGQRLSLYNGEGLPMSPLAPMDVEDAGSSAKTADPAFMPGSGFFSPSTNVTLSCATAGAVIRYTLDGSEPTEASAAYSAPIAISATTTIKARAYAAGKSASDIIVATYTLGTPVAPTVDPLWSISDYDPSAWTPLANNILAGKTGTTSGGLAWGDISKDPANLTDGTVPVEQVESHVVGFCDNSSISWTFAEPQTITELRISTRRATGGDTATALQYAGLRLEDVYVKKSGSSEWEALGTPVYLKRASDAGAMLFELADDGVGYLAENVVGLKVVFLKGGVVWTLVAEIEASGYATAEGPSDPLPQVATPVISPAACSFYPSTNVTLSCTTEGATIRYTLDGTTPTAASAVYSAPIAISATTTVKARAFAAEMNPSATASATFTYVEPSQPDDPPVDPPPPSGDKAFYIGNVGYDSWTDAMNAAKTGDTVSLGADAEFSGNQLKSLTIDLRGHTLTASTTSSPYIGNLCITVTDSIGGGLFTSPNGMNLQGSIDLSALTHDQFSIAGQRFWTGSATVAKFPAGWTLDECKATFRNSVKDAKIITQGVTYTYDGTTWVSDVPPVDPPVDPPVNPPAADKMFYIGETGYDTWADAFGAAADGATIRVGVNATFALVTTGKPITVDLCGRTLEWQASGWYWGTVTFVDSVGTGSVTLASGNRNVGGATIDLTALTAEQIAGTGKFYVSSSSVVKFPSDMTLDGCKSRIALAKAAEPGAKFVVKGKTYTWDTTQWVMEGGASYPEWIDDSNATVTAKYDTWAEAKGVSDPEAAIEDAYLLNCANTSEAVATAKAAFKITSITVDAEGNVAVGEPVPPAGGFNGTVTILGCETLDGEYHARRSGDLFFKAVLGL